MTAESPPKVLKEDIKTATAAVEAVNLATRKLTLRGSDGNVKDITVGEEVKNLPQVKVRDPKNLEDVKPGDEVVITYTEALAISVEKSAKVSVHKQITDKPH